MPNLFRICFCCLVQYLSGIENVNQTKIKLLQRKTPILFFPPGLGGGGGKSKSSSDDSLSGIVIGCGGRLGIRFGDAWGLLPISPPEEDIPGRGARRPGSALAGEPIVC